MLTSAHKTDTNLANKKLKTIKTLRKSTEIAEQKCPNKIKIKLITKLLSRGANVASKKKRKIKLNQNGSACGKWMKNRQKKNTK